MSTLTRSARRAKTSNGTRLAVVATSAFNVVSTGTAGIAGIVIARSLGPSARGEYAAIMVWFVLLLVVGGLGQSAATTFFVARDPGRAPDYVAVSRNILVVSGVVTLAVGMIAAPLLGSDSETVVWAYRLMFATCLAAFVGLSYTFALQGSSIARWNLARISQPVGYLVVVVVLHATGQLNLITVLTAFSATMVAQTVLAYGLCARDRLTGGRPSLVLVRPMARYGVGQLAATIPLVAIARLDQLALSVTDDPSALGNYAVAASLTALAVPVAAGLGYVAFPLIAAQRGPRSATTRLQWRAVAVSAAIAVALMLPLAALAPWLVPMVFGPGFDNAVVLVVLLTPGGVFMACQQVCADLLRGHGRPLAAGWAQAVAAGVMVVLLGTLMPVLGPPGAALASSISTGVAFLLLLRALSRALAADEQKEPVP
ncbi:oligosaccharide flippase family protein [Plantactinospora sp. KLBMP9567]|uniref:oligosaccharide flippase family protein n=1 Tax=Plantactinospora sp. KLBMP9567 TaxID=3085900 RepID=UPI002981F2F6|nr:oligosaccharide flippase family protein [Plantactinospora sp. KLBMP9567]MDW5330627.1 oligosaccharide flippase family protein [Plantactinospora sp. KLBMP9567]